MEEHYEDFIGIYDESVPVDLCNSFVENWEVAEKNQTIVDCTVENELGVLDISPHHARKDKVAFIVPTYSTIYPVPQVHAYFLYLQKCLKCYVKKYNFRFNGKIYNDVFKMHKVRKSEGYHEWHYEKTGPDVMDRIMVYMTYLEVPKKGGETEFLHQSLRVEPIVGRTLIWPAGYTHIHRGNPPLDGEKMYIDGWFTCGKLLEDGGNK